MKVFQAINAIQRDLAATGISKDRRNQQQGYNFRGIDDVFNALSPLLARHGLCILPRVTEREVAERQNAKGTALFYVTVGVEFDFVSAEDGSKHTIKTYGEAMDSGDKATNKAMSAAYKYAALQAFAIPTEADNDADAHTHEVRSGMTADSFNAALMSINGAQTVDALRSRFTTAIAAARSANDQEAAEKLTAAKDARKAALATEAA